MTESFNLGPLGHENANTIMSKGNPMMALTAADLIGEDDDEEEEQFSWFESAITLWALGELDGSNAPEPKKLTLGFVQNLAGSVRQVRYKDGHRFENRQPGFPAKDGTGDPWYKWGTGKLASVGGGQAKVPFRFNATDAPSFGYPLSKKDKMVELAVDTVAFHDTYHCCLAAKVEETGRPPALYFLHSVMWQFDVALPGEPIGGVKVTREQPIPQPFPSPVGFNTTGKPANQTMSRHFE
jgi:hypothetical protein